VLSLKLTDAKLDKEELRNLGELISCASYAFCLFFIKYFEQQFMVFPLLELLPVPGGVVN